MPMQCDPESSQSILSNSVLAAKTTLIGLDLSHQVLATRSVQERVLDAGSGGFAKNDLRQMLYELLLFFAGTYSAVFGIDEGPPLHDPVAVAVVLSNLNPEYAQSNPVSAIKFNDKDGERFAVTVVTDGQHGGTVAATGQLGRTIAKPVQGKGVAIPRGIDTDSFWDLLISCLERAEKGSPLATKSASQ
jgi:uridine nucleosidase